MTISNIAITYLILVWTIAMFSVESKAELFCDDVSFFLWCKLSKLDTGISEQ